MAENKPQPPPPVRLATLVGVVSAVLGSLVVAPLLFPRGPGQGFSVEQMLCAGAGGGLGAVLGWTVGRLIGGPPENG